MIMGETENGLGFSFCFACRGFFLLLLIVQCRASSGFPKGTGGLTAVVPGVETVWYHFHSLQIPSQNWSQRPFSCVSWGVSAPSRGWSYWWHRTAKGRTALGILLLVGLLSPWSPCRPWAHQRVGGRDGAHPWPDSRPGCHLCWQDCSASQSLLWLWCRNYLISD